MKKKTGWMVFQNIWIILTFLFLYLPIAVVVVFSFNTSKMNIVWEGFTLNWYGSFFLNRSLMESLENTLIIAAASTAISTVIGTIGAVGMSRYNYAGKNIIDYLLYIPIVIPEVVLGIALLCIFSICSIPLGLMSITIAHATFCIPFVVVTVRAKISGCYANTALIVTDARLAGFDTFLEEAAMDLGADRFKTFMKITLPLLMPGVCSGALLAFSLSLDDVIISFFVSGPNSITLPVKIFSMVKTGVTPEVNALSTIIMIVVMIIISINTGVQVKRLKKKAY